MASLSADIDKVNEERKELLKKFKEDFPSTAKPSLYDRLQALTRGYLVQMLALVFVAVLCGVIFFPKKMWYHLMLHFVDCVSIPGKKFNFKICNQDQPQEGFHF
jgi:hypothetical protein